MSSADDHAAAPEEPQTAEQRVIRAELGEMTELESMCPRCEKNGTTRLMITKIPHFREIIVSSFECPHCGEKNNEVQFGGEFGPRHVRYELEVRERRDLNRQVVKSEYATVLIPELDLEVPPQTQKGMLNTVEGIIQQTVDGLQMEQPVRKVMQPDVYEKIEAFCAKASALQTGNEPFHLIVDDPAGNSYVESYFDYYHTTVDPHLKTITKERTEIDRQLIGLAIEYNTQRTEEEETAVAGGNMAGEVMQMETQCSACTKPGFINMHACDIPHFKDTIIMAFKCDYCGFKSTEIKSGGAVSPHGLRLSLHVEREDDLKRDVLKSDSASLRIPEIELELAPGTLGGFFSTVEGTLTQIKEQLASLPQAQFAEGDSSAVNDEQSGHTLAHFISSIDDCISLKRPFTVILDDPLANVYIQNPKAHLPPPENVDTQLTSEEYTRTFEQDEELGFHDMHVE
mmetsp:Transcript_21521/g.25008  ORF Transcript_21521/g.25008 Transcript_21521/m.25008 type:complete len:456 (+) Transcript_21521:45-1412(+)|eukprot:CAMPEP_0176407894 /NCGR_PEP_ID=MMETSP0127-20121128/1654_1 /TAXON_ID=938130 /ORGANISM="Platyophrya macrostoma, Strain WH" /LENGTH=455 /DNA_ID=CAMNT_0017787129 /DNA_START=36 /DNA_END=1403 /DNA_ORIENTATION=-